MTMVNAVEPDDYDAERFVFTIVEEDHVWRARPVEHPKRRVTLDEMQAVVGGLIERVQMELPGPDIMLDVWVNESGLLEGLPRNEVAMRLVGHPMLVGNVIITKSDEWGESLALSRDEVQALEERINDVLGGSR